MSQINPSAGAPSTEPARWQRIVARTADLGGGLTIARALPSARRRTVGAWCFLDHAGPARFPPGPGMRVGPHPHIGLQTFTWMIEGQALHRDSLGNEQVIRPGEVNLMTAGRGIAHSEESLGGAGAVHAAQLWIALPEAQRQCEPAFVHHPELPLVQAGGFRVTVLAGRALDHESPVRLHCELLGLDLVADAAARSHLTLQPRFEHAVLCLRGAARVDDELLEPGTLLFAAAGRTQVELACDAATQLLLIGGVPFPEPLLIWWNFVARTQAEIEQAAADWNAGRRFGEVPATRLPRIPAPDTAGLRLRARSNDAP
ncbi:MAG TPA: pirin family protein [Burkholderiaceae bacterium]|nr:pirin family protein [Burkholderiaceae bacterium]